MAAKVNDDHVAPAVMPEDMELSCNAECRYVTCKEDMSYEELCTLEGMIDLFNHDKSLDDEIANLKEQSLLNTIEELEVGMQLKDNEIKAARETVSNCRDALMLMTYIDIDDIPKDIREDIIEAAAKRPSILLYFIDEDVIVSHPVPKLTDDGRYVKVDHGLKSYAHEIEDVLMNVSYDMEDV